MHVRAQIPHVKGQLLGKDMTGMPDDNLRWAAPNSITLSS